MLSDKKIAIVFFSLLGIGGLLIALAWHLKSNLGFVVGLIGGLFVLVALKWLEKTLETRTKLKRAAKKREEEAYFIRKELPEQEVFMPEQNPSLQKKLRWIFGVLAVVGISMAWFGKYLPGICMATGLPLGVWSAFMFAATQEKFDPEKPTRNFAFLWGSSKAFRSTNLLLGFLTIAVVATGFTFTPPPPKAVPVIIGTFAGMMILIYANHFYIQYALSKGVPDGWSLSEKRLERVVDILILPLMLLSYICVSIFLPNFIQELRFAMLFSVLGLVLGYLTHDFLKNRYTDFFQDEDRKWAILMKIYVGCLTLTLATAAFANWQTAGLNTWRKPFKITEISKNYRGKHYLWLEMDGNIKRFEPKMPEWESLQTADSSSVLIGTGILGFDCILKFDTLQ